jgi:hypothetical protein
MMGAGILRQPSGGIGRRRLAPRGCQVNTSATPSARGRLASSATVVGAIGSSSTLAPLAATRTRPPARSTRSHVRVRAEPRRQPVA